MQTDSPGRILRINTVLERTGLSRSTMYRKMQNGTLPASFKISERCAGWLESAVAEWQRTRCSTASTISRGPDAGPP
jgi:prophage regulatory protein